MARAETKAPKSKIPKREAPALSKDLVDYRITDMQQYEHFFVAKIFVVETGEEVTVHNRFGSWFIGDPAVEKGGHMKELLTSIRFALQGKLGRFKNEMGPPDPFASLKAEVPNPFAALAETEPAAPAEIPNPFAGL